MEATDLPEPKPGHTELPWYIGRSEKHGLVWIDSDYAPSSAIADLYQRIGEDLIPKENAEANACHIVSCVNAHDGLVACREALRLLLKGREAARGTGAGYLSSPDWAIARDALHLADSAPGGSKASAVSEPVTPNAAR